MRDHEEFFFRTACSPRFLALTNGDKLRQCQIKYKTDLLPYFFRLNNFPVSGKRPNPETLSKEKAFSVHGHCSTDTTRLECHNKVVFYIHVHRLGFTQKV